MKQMREDREYISIFEGPHREEDLADAARQLAAEIGKVLVEELNPENSLIHLTGDFQISRTVLLGSDGRLYQRELGDTHALPWDPDPSNRHTKGSIVLAALVEKCQQVAEALHARAESLRARQEIVGALSHARRRHAQDTLWRDDEQSL